MKKIVGIDFGTTNVRICEWDVDSDQSASSSLVGSGNSSVMPAVIAFTRLPGGDVRIEIGEEADTNELEDDPNTRVVIRNIKRWAVGSDAYVSQHLEWSLEQKGESWPTWWDPDSRTVRLWNETMPVEQVIRLILKEAISRAGLEGAAAEWRAGCPVNSNLAYRKAMLSALTDLGCAGKVQWITEEPLLLLSLGMEIGSLQDGSYLVYDLGGGSFDCAIAEISDGQMTVLSEEGIPTLGGMNIDDALIKKLSYDGPIHLLRGAKEQLSSNPQAQIPLPGNLALTQEDVAYVLENERFVERTLTAVLDAYKKAKLIWKRERHAGAPPIGEGLEEGNIVESYKSVWSLNYDDMVQDIDRVILVGGPTQMPYFRDQLDNIFGDAKILTAEDVVLSVGRADIDVPALTAISHGACHAYTQQYVPVTLDRIPASITLTVTDGDSIMEDEYRAFHKLPFHKPVADHVGQWVTLSSDSDRTYSVLIKTPDGEIKNSWGPRELKMPREGYRGPIADSARLVVDRLGRVWVEIYPISVRDDLEKVKDRHDMRHPFRLTPNLPVRILDDPFWQTEIQRKKINELYDAQREYEQEKKDILHHNITHNPFGYGERPG